MTKRFNLVLFILVLILAACSSATPNPDIIAKAVQATLTAAAPIVSSTQLPTSMPEPIKAAPTQTISAPATDASRVVTATIEPTATPAPTDTSEPSATPTFAPTDTPAPTATPSAPQVVASKAINLRAGPGTNYPVIGSAAAGAAYEVAARNADGSWFEVCCVNNQRAWVAASVVEASKDAQSIQVAANIPTPPPAPPTSTPKPTTAPMAIQRPGMHDRIRIGSWEIQAERIQNEKAVYQYDSTKVAMGRYAIVFVLAKNLAPGTQSISASLSPILRDDKGRVYDFSDPLTTERWAMIYAMWEFSVGESLFSDINPGEETPVLFLWDVKEDVKSLTLIMTDGLSRAEWDLGDFASIPPYKPQ